MFFPQKTEMLFKLSNLNSNLALTVGYLNLALKNSALIFNINTTKPAQVLQHKSAKKWLTRN